MSSADPDFAVREGPSQSDVEWGREKGWIWNLKKGGGPQGPLP